MKIKEITYGKSGVISKAAYENLKPFYSMTVELDTNDNIEERIQYIKDIIDKQFAMDEYKAKVDLLKKQYDTIKFYDAPNNLIYPSITSVLFYDQEWFIPAGELSQHGSAGTIIHKISEYTLLTFQKTGKFIWKEPKDFLKLKKEIGIIKRGNLGLKIEDYSYKMFGEKYFPKVGEILALEKPLLNHEIRTGGTPDIIAPYEDILSVIDLKTGNYDFRQLAFYAKTWNLHHKEKIKQMVIFPVGKNDNKRGYKQPIINQDIDGEYNEMLKKREKFRIDFGI